MSKLRARAQAFQEALSKTGRVFEVMELPASTRTAVEAAEAIGCSVAQIAKSIVFRGEESGDPVLVVASGVNRIRESVISEALGEAIGKATPEFVRESTGFVIGGVPPCGHIRPIRTFIDRDLVELEEIWAAAGTPHAVFKLGPADLLDLTGGTVLDVLDAVDRS